MTPEQKTAIRARLDDYAYKATLLAEMTKDSAERNALRKFGQAFRDARAALDHCELSNEKLRKLLKENGIDEV
jgi:hypothetical protein